MCLNVYTLFGVDNFIIIIFLFFFKTCTQTMMEIHVQIKLLDVHSKDVLASKSHAWIICLEKGKQVSLATLIFYIEGDC